MSRWIGEILGAVWWRRLRSPSAWPIVVRMSIDMLLAALIPLGLAVWLTSAQSRRELETAARTGLELLAQVTAAQLDQLVVDTSRMAQQMARDDSVQAICRGAPIAPEVRAAVQRQLDSVVETNPDYSSIFVTDAKGIGLAGTNPQNVGMDLAFREYCREALAGNVYVSDFLVGKTTGEPGVYFSAPVRARVGSKHSGPVIGAVALKLKGDEIWRLVDDINADGQLGKHGYGVLIDGNGIVIAHPRKELLYRSVAAIPQDRIRAIDPKTAYGSPTIESLNLPGLMGPATDPTKGGSFLYTVSGEQAADGFTTWVGGYAALGERPWKVAVVQPQIELSQAITSVVRRHGLVGLGVALVAGIMAVWRARTVVRPILALTEAARQLASGDFSTRARRYAADEVGQLAAAFNAMVPQLKERIDLQQSLAVAMEVQQSLLPDGDPDDPHLDIAGRTRYCDATGGDYYDFIEIVPCAARQTLIAVGDVSGHGVAAALVMALVRGALRAQVVEQDGLAVLLTKVNRVLSIDARHGRFVTLLLLVVDSDRGLVRWASAGHDPPLVYRAAAQFDSLDGGGLPLGILPEAQYEEYAFPGLSARDALVIGTDGVWETCNRAGELFGKERLQETIREHHGQPAAAMAQAIENSLAAFRGSVAQQDDVTFVVVRPK